MPTKIDSREAGLHYAEELSLKVLPGSPVWYEVEVNEYGEFGANITTTPRTPISDDRQNRKGVVTDKSVPANFGLDLTLGNLPRLIQGFMFADMIEQFETKPLNGTQIALTTTTTTAYKASSGLDGFEAGDLVFASGMGLATNDGIKRVTTAVAATLTVAETLVVEASVPSTGRVQTVGFQAASGDIDIAVTATTVTLTSTVLDFTTKGLTVGGQIFVGGDLSAEKFVSNTPGYAEIKSISANALGLRETTWTPATETGTGLTIRLFFGKDIKNETSANIVRRSYHLERKLGDDSGTQNQVVTGAVGNELSIDMENSNKVTMSLGFVGAGQLLRTGATGLLAGTRVAALGEQPINTSSDVFRIKIAEQDGTLNPADLLQYMTSFSLTINNGITENKAIGTLGPFELSAANFTVGGSLESHFQTVAALTAIENNADVSLSVILAEGNAGIAASIPLMTMSGGGLNVSLDDPIKIPIENAAAQNSDGYTLMFTFFSYLPTVAMPV